MDEDLFFFFSFAKLFVALYFLLFDMETKRKHKAVGGETRKSFIIRLEKKIITSAWQALRNRIDLFHWLFIKFLKPIAHITCDSQLNKEALLFLIKKSSSYVASVNVFIIIRYLVIPEDDKSHTSGKRQEAV